MSEIARDGCILSNPYHQADDGLITADVDERTWDRIESTVDIGMFESREAFVIAAIAHYLTVVGAWSQMSGR